MGNPINPLLNNSPGYTVGNGRGVYQQNRQSFNYGDMIAMIEGQNDIVKQKLANINAMGSSVSIGDMFDMQMVMNKLSQLSEMLTNVFNAAHTAIMSMARNVKG